MKVGIVGFARSGKTTIFNALTGAHAAVGTFGAREANVAVLKVPDARVDKLAEIHKPKKITYAEFQFVDVPPAEGAGEPKAIDEAALRELKNVDALVHVVRCFANEQVMHPLEKIDPARDVQRLEEEFQLSDLIVIEKRVARLEKENKKDREYEVLKRCQEMLESGKPLRDLDLNEQESTSVAGFGFLSRKPLMILGNYGEESIGKDDPSGLESLAQNLGLTLVALCGAMEFEVGQLPEEERAAFRADLGLGEGSRQAFIRMAYRMLGLISFLTAGEPEVRAWTIRSGTKAARAAGTIHSDIERGFIRAETVSYDDFIAAGTMVKAKEAGHVRLEGKEYEMKDGDIVHFRFNV